MVGETPMHESGDERGDLDALDFSAPYTDFHTPSDESGLAALDDYHPIEDDDGVPVPVFTVTNPPGTVTVTASMDGRVQHIELSPKLTDMTEADLADEIVVIAGLATQDAKSAQYAFMLEGMREQGHDDVATRDFLTRDLDLPTPEQAQAERAHIFATRYASDHD